MVQFFYVTKTETRVLIGYINGRNARFANLKTFKLFRAEEMRFDCNWLKTAACVKVRLIGRPWLVCSVYNFTLPSPALFYLDFLLECGCTMERVGWHGHSQPISKFIDLNLVNILVFPKSPNHYLRIFGNLHSLVTVHWTLQSVGTERRSRTVTTGKQAATELGSLSHYLRRTQITGGETQICLAITMITLNSQRKVMLGTPSNWPSPSLF